MKKSKILSSILAFGLFMQAVAISGYAEETVQPQQIYVRGTYAYTGSGSPRQPYKYIEDAKAAAIKMLADGDVEILIDGGTYFIDKALNFTSDEIGDTGNTLTIRPWEDGEEVIISGGEQLANSEFKLLEGTDNIYKIPYYSGTIQRQLYVNGTPAVRARSTVNDLTFDLPQGPTDVDENGIVAENEVGTLAITTSNTDVATWGLANVAEIVFKNSFVSVRKFITDVTVENNVATFVLKNDTYRLEQQYKLTGANGGIFWLENSLAVLDEPGEWCHDGRYIYYMPRVDDEGNVEDMETAEIVLPKLGTQNISGATFYAGLDSSGNPKNIPMLESPVSFTGKAGKPIKNITVKGITFSHNTWLYPSTSGELVPAQSNVVQGQPEVPGLVNTTYAEDIVFDGCTFTNGGGSGITILEGSKNITVTGCEISNISSAGILVGSNQSVNYGKDESKLIRNITIEQNTIRDCAIDYYSAPAISVAYEKDVKIVHNEIYNMPYSGLHLGCGWSYIQNSDVENIIVKYNYLHNCMQMMHDGGFIYTLGPTNQDAGAAGKRNEIAYNYLEDIESTDSLYLYHDNGSSYWNTHHNVIYQTDTAEHSWCNTAPDTHDLSIHNNFTNVSYETTTTRVNDSLLLDMFNKTNVVYEMSADGVPTANGNALDCAVYVKKNAGCKSTVLYDVADVKDTITLDNAAFMNEDILLHDGGSVSIDKAMLGAAFNFMLYAGDDEDGSLEIKIDDAYRAVLTKTGVTLYNYARKMAGPVSSTVWSGDGYTDLTLMMTDSNLAVAYGNATQISSAAAITEGKVKITANGMSAVIGALPKHYSLTADELELYGGDIKKSVASNGYFETDTSYWTYTSATLSRDTSNAYGDSLASLKVVESSTSSSATATTTVALSGGKWYRVSAMIKPDSSAVGKTAKFTSSEFSTSVRNVIVKKETSSTQTYGNYFRYNFFGKEFTLNEGWNKITDYVMVDSDTNVTLGIVVSGQSTYYVDNFEVVEETPTLTEYGFENGIGCWKASGSGVDLSITDNDYTGKVLKVESTTATYYHPVRPVHLERGKTYKAKAKVYVESLTDGSDATNVLFSVHEYYNYVNQQDQYGYQTLNVPVGQWKDMEFTFTWKAAEENSVAFLKMRLSNLGTWYIDDVELAEVPEGKVRTENADFTSRTNDWEYSSINSLDFTTGEGVKVTPADATATVSQEISMISGVDYYAEGFVKLAAADNDNYTLANILVTDENGKALMTSTDFGRRGKNMRSTKQVITSDKWTKIGGKIRFDADSITTPAKLTVEVANDDGTVPAYSIKGLKLVPVSDMKSTLTNAAITDGAVTYTATGETGSKVRYTYYTYNNGWTKSLSGYVNVGTALPAIGEGKAFALITTTAANGADEITEIAETAEISLITATKTDTAISIKAAGNNPQNKKFIIGIYSKNGELFENGKLLDGEYFNGDITIDNPAEAVEVKAFIWDMELIKPMCDALSATVN